MNASPRAKRRTTHLCWVRKYRAARDERWRIRAEFARYAGCPAGLVYLNDDILAFYIGTMHRLLRFPSILFSPKLDDPVVFADGGLCSYGSECAERTEKVIQL